MSGVSTERRPTDELLLGIANCPNVARCLDQPGSGHACAKVVGAQRGFDGEHVLPEPWSGHLETAPILFVSSNPSISGGELAPRMGWSDEQMVDFYRYRFGDGSRGVDQKRNLGTESRWELWRELRSILGLRKESRGGIARCPT